MNSNKMFKKLDWKKLLIDIIKIVIGAIGGVIGTM